MHYRLMDRSGETAIQGQVKGPGPSVKAGNLPPNWARGEAFAYYRRYHSGKQPVASTRFVAPGETPAGVRLFGAVAEMTRSWGQRPEVVRGWLGLDQQPKRSELFEQGVAALFFWAGIAALHIGQTGGAGGESARGGAHLLHYWGVEGEGQGSGPEESG